MDFTPMTAREYRELGAENYETRRSTLLALAEAVPEDATDEQISAIDAEVSIIADEDQRRSKLAHARNAAREFVQQGAGVPVAHTEKEDAMDEPKKARNLGENFVMFRDAHKGAVANNHYVAPVFRAATDPTTAAVSTAYDTDVAGKPATPLTVLDLFAAKTIDAPVYSFLQYTATEGAAGTTDEGAKKNQLHYSYEPKSDSLKKVTGFTKMTDELFEDSPYLANEINTTLMDDLNAARQATAIATLLATSGIQKMSVAKADAITVLDAILNAISDVETQSGKLATGIAITPALWTVLRAAKLTTNEYIAGSPFGTSDVTRLFELTFVKCPAVTEGHIIVGAFDSAALVQKADGIKVESTNSDGEDFTKDLVTVRAEKRELLAVKYPAAFCDLTVASV